jgi:hypothetical protein
MEKPPSLDVAALPVAEQESADLINEQLASLQSYVEDFTAALDLFDFTDAMLDRHTKLRREGGAADGELERLQRAGRWRYVAGRDGAMTVYHFATVFAAIQTTTAASPSISADRSFFKRANKLLDRAFPSLIRLRDSIAHAGWRVKTTARYSNSSVSGGFSKDGLEVRADKVSFSNSFVNRNFTNTWQGKAYSYELSKESLAQLVAARNEIWSAFETSGRPSP